MQNEILSSRDFHLVAVNVHLIRFYKQALLKFDEHARVHKEKLRNVHALIKVPLKIYLKTIPKSFQERRKKVYNEFGPRFDNSASWKKKSPPKPIQNRISWSCVDTNKSLYNGININLARPKNNNLKRKQGKEYRFQSYKTVNTSPSNVVSVLIL